MLLECGILASDFIWASTIGQGVPSTAARLDYIPGETMPDLVVDPLNTMNNPVYIDSPGCPAETPIWWWRHFRAYDPSGNLIYDPNGEASSAVDTQDNWGYSL